jgi:membrane protein
VSRLIATFRDAGKNFSLEGCAFLAQAIAFNAVFATFPLILLVIAVLGFMFGTSEGQARALTLVASLAPGLHDVLSNELPMVVRASGISGAISIIALVWSGKNLFTALAYALDRSIGVTKGRPLVTDITVAIVTIPIVGIVLIGATMLPIAISFIVQQGGLPHAVVISQVASYLIGALAIFVLALLLYDYLPNHKVSWQFGIPGALFTATAWELAQIAFGIYTAHVNFGAVYGAITTLVILLLWFYYMASIFLFGAQLSSQWHEHGSSEPARLEEPHPA